MLTGIPVKKIQAYAKDNNPFNILEHPMVLEPSVQQLEKINRLNKIISNYNLLKMEEEQKGIRFTSSSEAGRYFVSVLGGVKDKEQLNNIIMELTEQSHILSRVLQKGYMDSALFIEKQNRLNIEIEQTKKQRNGILESNGYDKEIAGTQRLLEIIKYNPDLMSAYDENLFIHTVDQIVISDNKAITFRLINNLELTEYIRERGES